MVTVVSKVPHPSVVREVICKHCGSTLQYVPRDIKEYNASDYTGGRDISYYIQCPTCENKVWVNRY